MSDTKQVMALAEAQLTDKQRRANAHHDAMVAQGKIAIRTKYEALRYGDEWQERARRTQAQLDRTQMLLFCAEAHAKASDILREYAESECERLRRLVE